jgi:murein DD-endopeptidase MepM/ murein hydrolase activator NlpD
MKNKIGQAALSLGFFLVAFMAGITACVVVEYYFFRKHLLELLEIKEHYKGMVDAFKKRLASVRVADTQGKTSNSLAVVNRDAGHLKQAALQLAHSSGLERVVKGLYERGKEIKAQQIQKDPPPKKQQPQYHKQGIKAPLAKKKRLNYKGRGNDKMIQLKREHFFALPITRKQFWVSSPFGPRKSPDGTVGFHTGVDLAAVRGTEVKAVADGKVEEASFAKGYGNMVYMSHPYDVKTRYAHLAHIRAKVGQVVKRGDVIGTVGNTGNVRRKRGSDGSHLHFELYIDNRRVDPLYFFR